MNTQSNRRVQGYVYLVAGIVTGGLFLFVLSAPDAWANPVNGFVLAGSEPKAVGQTINLGSGKEISIGDLAKMIAGKLGKSLQIEQDDSRLRPPGSEVERLLADNRLASELLGWEPVIDLSKGLDITIEWLQKNIHKYRLGAYTL